MSSRNPTPGPEWPTLVLIIATHVVWALLTINAAAIGLWAAVPLLALTLTLHSSLQHEVLHGHPLPDRRLSEALVFLPLGLVVPFQRFRDLHLAHHRDSILTDPYDDPESNYLDPAVWARLSGSAKALFAFNNTLIGRMLVGPAIGMVAFLRDDLRAARAGDRAVIRAWALHGVGLVPVLLWLAVLGSVPAWAYAIAVYLALSILKIRTFLEHQAHLRARGRTVIIEDRGPLAFLFLNNNFHAVHHAHPGVAWYALPRLYASRRGEFLQRNLGYRYASYGEVMRRYLFRPKDPVAHPFMDG
jgi:fatty acid desaturase